MRFRTVIVSPMSSIRSVVVDFRQAQNRARARRERHVAPYATKRSRDRFAPAAIPDARAEIGQRVRCGRNTSLACTRRDGLAIGRANLLAACMRDSQAGSRVRFDTVASNRERMPPTCIDGAQIAILVAIGPMTSMEQPDTFRIAVADILGGTL